MNLPSGQRKDCDDRGKPVRLRYRWKSSRKLPTSINQVRRLQARFRSRRKCNKARSGYRPSACTFVGEYAAVRMLGPPVLNWLGLVAALALWLAGMAGGVRDERPGGVGRTEGMADTGYREESAGVNLAASGGTGGGAIPGTATHYGAGYNGSPLGCAGAGVYSSDRLDIVAVGPARYTEWPCGTRLRVCGLALSQVAVIPDLSRDKSTGLDAGAIELVSELRCIEARRLDSCPGCGANVIDLSEAGFAAVCGALSRGVCGISIEVVP